MFQEVRSGDSVAVGGPERLHKWELGLQEWMKFDEFRSQHAFSLKGQLVITLVFAGASIATIQLCCCRVNSSGQYRSKKAWLCSSKTLLTKQVVNPAVWIWPKGYCSLTPGIREEEADRLCDIIATKAQMFEYRWHIQGTMRRGAQLGRRISAGSNGKWGWINSVLVS